MKEFNLNEYLKNPSRKIVTRDGREVRIVCTDMKGKYPIVALICEGDEERVYTHSKDGYWLSNSGTKYDLFFAPTKREGWINIYKGVIENHLPYVGQKVYKSKEEAIKNKCSDCYFTTLKIEWEE